MTTKIVAKILERVGQPDLVKLLAQDLSGSELNSVLLEVFNERVAMQTPAQLFHQYQQNRFVKPADLPVVALRRMELDLFDIFEGHGFAAVELSPTAVLGSCSVLGPADQKKILSALRGTEVLADATNAIALHVADLKQRKAWVPETPGAKLRFSCIQRHVRTQQVAGKGFTPHFKIACLATCGYDTGNFTFEKETLAEHIATMKRLYAQYHRVEDVRFRFLCRDDGDRDSQSLAGQVKDYVVHEQPGTLIDIIEQPEREINYYKGIQYKIDIRVKGKTYEIGDGGFVDWTQQLLQNKKERMFTTGIGFEFMYRIITGQL